MPRTTFRCVAFTSSDAAEFPPSLHEARHWTRCPTRSQHNDHFCPAHRDALDGVILGLHQWQQHLHGAERENEAHSHVPDKTSACKACGAPTRWKIPRSLTRRLSAQTKRRKKAVS